MGGQSSKNVPITSASPTPYTSPTKPVQSTPTPTTKKPVTIDKLKEGKYYKLVTPIMFDVKTIDAENSKKLNNNMMSKFHKLRYKDIITTGVISSKVRFFKLEWEDDPSDEVVKVYSEIHRDFIDNTTTLDSQYALDNYKDFKPGDLAQPRDYSKILFVEGSGPTGGRRKTIKQKVKLNKKRKSTHKRV